MNNFLGNLLKSFMFFEKMADNKFRLNVEISIKTVENFNY